MFLLKDSQTRQTEGSLETTTEVSGSGEKSLCPGILPLPGTTATALGDLLPTLETCPAAERIGWPPLHLPGRNHSTEIPRGTGMDIPGIPAQLILSIGQGPSAESSPTTRAGSLPLTLTGTTGTHTDPIEATVIGAAKPTQRQGALMLPDLCGMAFGNPI